MIGAGSIRLEMCQDAGLLVLEPRGLAEVEVPEKHHHTELVRAIENPLQPGGIFGAQRTVGIERRVFLRLLLGVSLRRPALNV